MSPGLEKYIEGPIAGLWERRELSRRDRSIVRVAALIARNQTGDMPACIGIALDGASSRPTPSAAAVAKAVFEKRAHKD